MVNDLLRVIKAKEIVDLLEIPIFIEEEIKRETIAKRVHFSTKIEGNNLNLDQVKDILEKEFKIDNDVTHVVAIKLTAIKTKVVKDEAQISVNGSRAYDAEHLNGSDYTFIILEAVPDNTSTISVKWNKDAEELNYVVYFSADLNLK